MTKYYDVIVVGAGLIGSAAARHLVEISPGLKVLLVGPEEPQDRSCTDVFGAHYDEGRVTRVLDPDPTWALLALRSIHRYRHLEHKSGVRFYHEVGFLALGLKDGEYTSSVRATARALREPVEILEPGELRRRFPFLSITNHHQGVFTKTKSGHISPRNLVAAQKAAALKSGCDVINDIVRRVAQIGSEEFEVEGERSGVVYRGRRVLLATGCFTDCRKLLPEHLSPEIENRSVTVLLAEVDPRDLFRFAGMPSVISEGLSGNIEADNKSDFGCFALPPIKYPNGRHYVKVGHGFGLTTPLRSPGDLAHWYRHGSHHRVRTFLTEALHDLFPDVHFRDFRFEHCAVALTPSTQLYVDLAAPGLGVALGGCGYAAKSSDEIGRVAARMMLAGGWDYDLPHELFRVRWKPRTQARL